MTPPCVCNTIDGTPMLSPSGQRNFSAVESDRARHSFFIQRRSAPGGTNWIATSAALLAMTPPLVIARAAGPWQSSAFHPARSAAESPKIHLSAASKSPAVTLAGTSVNRGRQQGEKSVAQEPVHYLRE
jgi:hypothetical protein